MEKQRAFTIQQRFGFQDNDLKTASHDEIMLWLQEPVRLAKIINGLFYRDWNLTGDTASQGMKFVEAVQNEILTWGRKKEDVQRQIAKMEEGAWHFTTSQLESLKKEQGELEQAINQVGEWQLGEPRKARPLEIKDIIWEVPVTTGKGSKYVVGFIDLAVTYTIESIWVTGLDYRVFDLPQRGYRWGIAKNSNYGKPEIEQREKPRWVIDKKDAKVYFEVKSSIPSLGELIRQIRLYQEYVDAPFVIVCPDDTFAQSLQAQGIDFVKYEPSY